MAKLTIITGKYPSAKCVYIDEAQHLYPDGVETKEMIGDYLNAGFDVFAAGVFHNRDRQKAE